MGFWTKTNYFIKGIFSNYVWDIANNENKVYLTFDDGPTPKVTEWTLEQLKKHNAKATFFCIGNNIEEYSDIFRKIIEDGHATGNHTFDHLNGWKTDNQEYFENIKDCTSSIFLNSRINKNQPTTDNRQLFRPPYGKIKPSQSKKLRALGYKIIMWDIISYDFNPEITPQKCLENVLLNVRSGSIIVFHDSVKAEQNLKYALPRTLKFLQEKGFVCAKIELD